MEFEYTGENKEAAKLKEGDFVTLTGYVDNVAEIEEVYPIGDEIAIRTADGAGKTMKATKVFRLYV